jgi:hypothetical protein
VIYQTSGGARRQCTGSDRTGTTITGVLPAVTAAALEARLGPVIEKDAILVTDAAPFYPPCAAAMDVTHQPLNQTAGERRRGDLHLQNVNSRHERLKSVAVNSCETPRCRFMPPPGTVDRPSPEFAVVGHVSG